MELTEPKQLRVEKRALSGVHREVGGRKEGGEDWLREKEVVNPKCAGFSRNLSLALVDAKI